MTAPIQETLAKKDLLPNEHIVDAGYMDATLLVTSQTDHQVQLTGPVRPDSSWQAQANTGYDISCFRIDWEAQKVTCPQGQTSRQWIAAQDAWGNGEHQKVGGIRPLPASPCLLSAPAGSSDTSDGTYLPNLH